MPLTWPLCGLDSQRSVHQSSRERPQAGLLRHGSTATWIYCDMYRLLSITNDSLGRHQGREPDSRRGGAALRTDEVSDPNPSRHGKPGCGVSTNARHEGRVVSASRTSSRSVPKLPDTTTCGLKTFV